ncbi:hypothetical protein DSM112329_02786 [Paraconexibacter sp. AEG42_29]|uniref:DUF3556 domain-containing protein n=1 Tax=Paraconexibacter sp. AEG42_29 TaxID=2997339 RepID=A0AAU7AW22_9ACTN
MGFINPAVPPDNVLQSRDKPELERIKPIAQDWAVNGFGSPSALYVLYLLKLAAFVFVGILIIGRTEGLGGVSDVGDWWTEPIVFQKALCYMVLYEMFGFGSSTGPLGFRFIPPMGNVWYWARPGTLRVPPWQAQNPLAGSPGNRRSIVDVALYLGVLGLAAYLLFSNGTTDDATGILRLDTTILVILLVVWAALGVRDQVPFLCGRPEVYGLMLFVCLFDPANWIVGWQIAIVCIWLGAAASKLTRHFGSVVAVMVANTPWQRSKTAKKMLWRNYPEDLRASKVAEYSAHAGFAIEFFVPLVLLFSYGGTVGKIAVVVMVIFHIHITSTLPIAVPLEWNLFMIFGILFLFDHYGAVPLNTLESTPLLLVLLVVGVAIPIWGNMRPDQVSFLPAMRYYAGNWATTQWLFRKDTAAEDKLDSTLVKSSPLIVKQLETLYDPDAAELFLDKARAFRSMHPHGRALNGLLKHAAPGGDVDAYTVREGEFLSGVLVGWNFGDAHWHGHNTLAAVQEQCRFAPGDVRVIELESQPIHKQFQRYRIYDAVDGLVEEGTVKVKDMIEHQPWLDLNYGFPIDVEFRAEEAPSAGGAPRAPVAGVK